MKGFSSSRGSATLSACVLAFLLLVCAASVRAQGSAGESDSGTFQILSGKNKIGAEKFQIKRGDNGWEITGELQIENGGAKLSETSSLRLDAAFRPVAYQRTQKSPLAAKLNVEFGPLTTLVAGAEGADQNEQVFFLPDNDLVVLDTNFFHHYSILIWMYDRAKGGVQPFNVFIPQEALPGTISVEYIAQERQEDKELDHFQATTDQLQLEIWAAPGGAIQRISIPAANLEITRQ